MARGLVLCFHGGSPSILLSSSLSRVSIPVSPSKCNQSFVLSHWFGCHRRCFTRFFCKCALVRETIDKAKYKEVFEMRMAMAGLKPHHRIAVGVSGGPDSMALCVLAANWKTSGPCGVDKSNGFIDGLLGIVVDHGLRPESRDEAQVVGHRVSRMRIRCHIARCDWINGRPKLGRIQEAAREMRYQMLQNVCFQNQIGVLLVAHHADDQAELFILRLSRNSGVLGLAGMPFTSNIFSSEMHCLDKNFRNHSLLLVRPLLDLWKEDMYEICKWGDQDWVEDPTNKNQAFARNRIRFSIGNLPSSTFKSELQAVISACRKTRSFIDQVCSTLINQAVTIIDQGYAILDLQNLNLSKVPDICLSKFIALILQFISQRQRPVRGSISKLLLDYIRTIPCKTSLTAAGCYLCPAPRSKGTKILVCCSVDCPLPSDTDVLLLQSDKDQTHGIPYDWEQIIAGGKSFSEQSVATSSEVPFLDTKSESVLTEARRLNILSESTYKDIILLQTEERNLFRFKIDKTSKLESNHKGGSTFPSRQIWPGQVCYFMNRFVLTWKLRKQSEANCECCVVSHEIGVEVRHMVESDWLYLSNLSKCMSTGTCQIKTKTDLSCSDFLRLSAERAVFSLKSVPAAVRRSLPVLVDLDGLLLSIPTIGFRRCPCIEASASFMPRVPLGRGHSSFI